MFSTILSPITSIYQARTKYKSPVKNPSYCNVALISHEANFTGDVMEFIDLQSVEDAGFAQDTNTYQIAKGLFAGDSTDNIRRRKGSLLIFKKINTTPATQGSITTISLDSTKITALSLKDDLEMNITIGRSDGADINIDIKEINLKGITDLTEQVAIIQNTINKVKFIENGKKIPLGIAVDIVDTNKIRFTNKDVGENSTIVIAAVTNGTGTDITSSTYLDIANVSTVTVDGANEVQEKTEVEMLQAISKTIYRFTAFAFTYNMEDQLLFNVAYEMRDETDSQTYYDCAFFARIFDPKDSIYYQSNLYDTKCFATRLVGVKNWFVFGAAIGALLSRDYMSPLPNNEFFWLHMKQFDNLVGNETTDGEYSMLESIALQYTLFSKTTIPMFSEPIQKIALNSSVVIFESQLKQCFQDTIMALQNNTSALSLNNSTDVLSVKLKLESLFEIGKQNKCVATMPNNFVKDASFTENLYSMTTDTFWEILEKQQYVIDIYADLDTETLFLYTTYFSPVGIRKIDLTNTVIKN